MSGYLTVEQAAERLRVTRQTIYSLVKAGKLHKHESAVGGIGGRRTFFDRAEVDELASHIIRPKRQAAGTRRARK